jgi:ATP-binding cassette subfamily F protein 3
LLLVSHDRALLDAVGSRTVELYGQELHSYVGGWPEYLRVRAERAATPASPPGPPAAKTARPRKTSAPVKAPKAATGSRPSPNGARRLETQIESAEAALSVIEDELGDPAAWSTAEVSAHSTARHEQAKRRVADLYARYETVAG